MYTSHAKQNTFEHCSHIDARLAESLIDDKQALHSGFLSEDLSREYSTNAGTGKR